VSHWQRGVNCRLHIMQPETFTGTPPKLIII
jgi:hypothetical protein